MPRYDHGRVLIPAKLAGTDVLFLFTNATDSWIRADVAERLAMGRVAIPPEVGIFVGGHDPVRERRTAALEIGGLRYRDFAFVPSPKGYSENPDVVGTLGIDAFAHADVDLEFDLAHDAINVIARNDCPAPPWAIGVDPAAAVADGDGVSFTVMLDGQRLRATAAPALPQSRMPAFAARAHFHLFSETQQVDPNVHGPATLLRHRFAALSVGTATLAPLDIEVVRQYALPSWSYNPPLYPFVVQPLDAVWFDSSDPPPNFYEPSDLLLLGVADLKRLRLYFAFRKNQVFAIPAP